MRNRGSDASRWTSVDRAAVDGHFGARAGVTVLVSGIALLAASSPASRSSAEPVPRSTSSPVRSSATVQLSATADSYVAAARPTSNYGDHRIAVGTSSHEIEAQGLVRFDLSAIPPGSQITEALLELTVNSATGDSAVDVALSLVEGAWGEGVVTWNTRPTTASPFASVVVGAEPGVVYSWPVAKQVQDWLWGAAPNYGLSLQASGGRREFDSHDYGLATPRLVVTYEPAAPTVAVTPTATTTLPAPDCAELTMHGGFEGDPDYSWSVQSNSDHPVLVHEATVGPGFEAHGGDQLAWLGGYDGAEVALRTVVPVESLAATTKLRLSYWWRVDSIDTRPGADRMEVWGSRVSVWYQQLLDTRTNWDARQTWRYAEFDVSGAIGPTATPIAGDPPSLRMSGETDARPLTGEPDARPMAGVLNIDFAATTDGSWGPTSFFIDDVSVLACQTVLPTVTPDIELHEHLWIPRAERP